jgi:predicted DNA-binding protein (MmcQ/YjbR family)
VDAVRTRLLEFALSLPGAVEEHPWEQTVAKVRTKVFVFFDGDPTRDRITVKLVESHGHALAIEGAAPSGYGLGKSGWVTLAVDASGLDHSLLCDWIEESYRIVAPKRLARSSTGEPTASSGRRGSGTHIEGPRPCLEMRVPDPSKFERALRGERAQIVDGGAEERVPEVEQPRPE